MKKIVLIALSFLLLAGSALAEIRVYDANGQFLGIFLDESDTKPKRVKLYLINSGRVLRVFADTGLQDPDWAIPISEIPFALPVTVPMRSEYVNCCEQPSQSGQPAFQSIPTLTLAGFGIMSTLFTLLAVNRIRKRKNIGFGRALKQALWLD